MSSNAPRISRRRILKTTGVAAVGGGAAALLGASGVGAQSGAPAILTNNQAGRKFRALVKHDANPASIVELTTRPLAGNRALVRVEASTTCYTIVGQVLSQGPTSRASVVGHGGVAVVEAVGPQVNSVQVGDRVLVTVHNACGRCYNCLRMRSDKCAAQFA